MKIAIISENNNKVYNQLIDEFKKHEMEAEFVDIGSLTLQAKDKNSNILYNNKSFENFDAVYLQTQKNLILFTEPFLNELSDRGIYCQVKPSSLNILANRPYLFSILNSRGVKTEITNLFKTAEEAESITKTVKYPVLLETFKGVDRTHRILVENSSVLESFLKSDSLEVDIISIQEYMIDDLNVSAVIGDEVFSIEKKWVKEKKEHSKSEISVKLNKNENDNILKSVKSIGLDIATVSSKQGLIVGIKSKIDIERFNNTLGEDLYRKIVQIYKERLS